MQKSRAVIAYAVVIALGLAGVVLVEILPGYMLVTDLYYGQF